MVKEELLVLVAVQGVAEMVALIFAVIMTRQGKQKGLAGSFRASQLDSG